MKKILTLGASSSKNSINKTFAQYAGSQLKDCECITIDLNDFEMPIYSIDREEANPIPQLAIQFVEIIESVDGVILSLAEHNGSYTSIFKNIIDWASRHKKTLWSEKSMLLLSTSPGGRAASLVMQTAQTSFPHLGAKIVANFSLPSFYTHFKEGEITDNKLKSEFKAECQKFQTSLKSQ